MSTAPIAGFALLALGLSAACGARSHPTTGSGRTRSARCFFPARRRLYFEAATGRRSALTGFTHRGIDNLGEERLDQLTHFGVIGGDLGQRTAGATDKDLAILTFNSRLTAKARKKPECLLESLFKPARIRCPMRPAHPMTHLAQSCFELLRAEALFQLSEDAVEEWPVCLRKEFLALRRQFVRKMRFAKTGPLTPLVGETIAFQRGKVRANRVIGQSQRVGQLRDRPRLFTEKQDDLSARALKKATRPAGDVHPTRLAEKLPQANKHKNNLTYCSGTPNFYS